MNVLQLSRFIEVIPLILPRRSLGVNSHQHDGAATWRRITDPVVQLADNTPRVH
jgi:hypothetical protein